MIKAIPNLIRQFDDEGNPLFVYYRRIPADLQDYIGRTIIKIEIGSSLEEAKIRVDHLNQQHNALFDMLRSPNKVGHEEARDLLTAYNSFLEEKPSINKN